MITNIIRVKIGHPGAGCHKVALINKTTGEVIKVINTSKWQKVIK